MQLRTIIRNTHTSTILQQFVKTKLSSKTLFFKVYIPFVFLGPKIVKKFIPEKGYNLKSLVQLSNFIFCTFSFAGSAVSGYYLYLLYSEGEDKTTDERIQNTICDRKVFTNYHGKKKTKKKINNNSKVIGFSYFVHQKFLNYQKQF